MNKEAQRRRDKDFGVRKKYKDLSKPRDDRKKNHGVDLKDSDFDDTERDADLIVGRIAERIAFS